MNSHTEDISHRDRESAERHQRDQFPSGTPRQSNTASLQIHQPVASRLPGAIHSPGGLLATHGGSGPPIPLGAPSGPVNSFGGSLQPESNRPIPHNAQNASNQMFGALGGNNAGTSNPPGAAAHLFGGPLQQQEGNRTSQNIPFGSGSGISGGSHTIPGGAGAGAGTMPQGQQPILNVSDRHSTFYVLHLYQPSTLPPTTYQVDQVGPPSVSYGLGDSSLLLPTLTYFMSCPPFL